MDLRLTTIVAVQVAIEPFYLSKENPLQKRIIHSIPEGVTSL